MKEYPSISSKPILDKYIYAFDKIDGSNIRVEYNKKNGFYKFGRRNGLLDDSNPNLLCAPKLFVEKYQDKLLDAFKKEKIEQATCFFELYGDNSFAGNHTGQNMDVFLFDISVHKKGFMSPSSFVEFCIKYKLEYPKIVYQGLCDQDFISSIINSENDKFTFEGVVCKGEYVSPGMPLMFKIKSKKWIDAVKGKFGENYEI